MCRHQREVDHVQLDWYESLEEDGWTYKYFLWEALSVYFAGTTW